MSRSSMVVGSWPSERRTVPSSSSVMSRVKHVVSLDYIQNNRNHLITTTIFLAILGLAMLARGAQFVGKSKR